MAKITSHRCFKLLFRGGSYIAAMLHKMCFCIHKCTLLWIVLFFLITFGAILPIFIWNQPFSFYFLMDNNKAISIIENKNNKRVQEANSYIEKNNNNVYQFYKQRLKSEDLYLLVMIITTTRSQNANVQYLTQSAVFTHQQIQRNLKMNAALMICNVDVNPKQYVEAIKLSHYFPSLSEHPATTHLSIYEKEKLDYLFCLEHAGSFHPNYVLILEDDSLPEGEMLSYLDYIIKFKIEKSVVSGDLKNNTLKWLALKLYYPEAWMGFSNELYRILQLIAVGFIFSGIFVIFVRRLALNHAVNYTTLMLYIIMIFGFLYGLLLALAIGRQNLLEIWRFHPSFIQVIKAPGCCTPATLYPVDRINGLIDFLNNVHCSSNYGLDLAIDDYAKKNNYTILQTEPNLFRHIGFHSTLHTAVKERTEEFLI